MRPACKPGDPGHSAAGLGASLDWCSCKKKSTTARPKKLTHLRGANKRCTNKRWSQKKQRQTCHTTTSDHTHCFNKHPCNLLPLETKPVQRCAKTLRKALSTDCAEMMLQTPHPSCVSDHCIPGEVLPCSKNQPRPIQPCDIYKHEQIKEVQRPACGGRSKLNGIHVFLYLLFPAGSNTSQC